MASHGVVCRTIITKTIIKYQRIRCNVCNILFALAIY